MHTVEELAEKPNTNLEEAKQRRGTIRILIQFLKRFYLRKLNI
jgi:hypothetical protein